MYDRHHRSIVFRLEDEVYLRLHKSYTLSSIKTSKLTIQRVESFHIIEKKENLTYKLDFSQNWKIYSIIFVINLESALKSDDFYNRSKLDYFQSMSKFNSEWHVYEIKNLIDYKRRRYKREQFIFEFLVRWKNYDLEFDRWLKKNLLNDVQELIEKYKKKHEISVNMIIRRFDFDVLNENWNIEDINSDTQVDDFKKINFLSSFKKINSKRRDRSSKKSVKSSEKEINEKKDEEDSSLFRRRDRLSKEKINETDNFTASKIF